MSFEDSAPGGITNAVRELSGAELFTFPAERIVRRQPGARGDQVAVTHRGDTVIFACPEDLREQVRANDPDYQAKVAELDALRVRAQTNLRETAIALRQARASKAQPERRLEFLARGFLVALALAGAHVLGLL
jgi:hypothetical protein